MKKGDTEKTLERKRIKLVKDGFRFKTQYSLYLFRLEIKRYFIYSWLYTRVFSVAFTSFILMFICY